MSKNIENLLNVMARLRDPNGGCPWDLEQDFKTIAPYTLEETYEVVEAIEQGDMAAIKDELGDLLFQIVFHAQMAKEQGLFTFDDIAGHVANKMVERHPHVFGERAVEGAANVVANWEDDKAKKREATASADGKTPSALDGVSTALPATTRAVKLQKRAARVGFDWATAKDILPKIQEEAAELAVEIDANDRDKMEDEFGDLFFVLTNLARKLDIDPETALRRTNQKFERRFRAMETRVHARGKTLKDMTLDEMEAEWQAVKAAERPR